MIGQTGSIDFWPTTARLTRLRTLGPFQTGLSRKDWLAHASRTQQFKGPRVQILIGETNPNLFLRNRIESGISPSMAWRKTCFVNPPPILLVSGSAKP